MWNGHLWFRVEGPFVARRSIVTVLIVGRIVCMCGYLKLVLGSYSSLVLFLVVTGLGVLLWCGPCTSVRGYVR